MPLLIIFGLSFLVGMLAYFNIVRRHIQKDDSISKSSWHYRFLSFCGVDVDDIRSLCSYSWLLWLMVFLSPIIGLGYGAYRLLRPLGSKISEVHGQIEDYCAARLKRWEETQRELILTEMKAIKEGTTAPNNRMVRALFHYWNPYTSKGIVRHAKSKKIHGLLLNFSQYEQDEMRQVAKEHIEAIMMQMAQEAREKEKREERRQINYDKLAAKGRVALKAIGVLVIIGLLFMAWNAVVWYIDFLVNRVDWAYTFAMWGKFTLVFFKIVAIGGLCLIGIAGIFHTVHYLRCKLGSCLPCDARRQRWGDSMRRVWNPIREGVITVVAAIGATIEGTVAFIRALKQDNCPMIEWKE